MTLHFKKGTALFKPFTTSRSGYWHDKEYLQADYYMTLEDNNTKPDPEKHILYKDNLYLRIGDAANYENLYTKITEKITRKIENQSSINIFAIIGITIALVIISNIYKKYVKVH